MTGRAKTISVFVVVLIGAGILEVCSYAAGRFLQSHYKMYRVPAPQVSTNFDSYDEYLTIRDPQLGWPFPKQFGHDEYDSRGSRMGTDRLEDSVEAVAIYGDSFAFGAEVEPEESWGYRLSDLLEQRVGNYGVNGYGTDQAFLRYKLQDRGEARVVILAHLSEDIIRNLTRDFDLYTGQSHYGLKPRFTLNASGTLTLIELPTLTAEEYERSIGRRTPVLCMDHENLGPCGTTGETLLKFPYTYAVLRNAFGYRMRSAWSRTPDYSQFYLPNSPSQGLEITAAILDAFCEEAHDRGQRPLILLIPTHHDIEYATKTGRWTYSNLKDTLTDKGIEVLDFGPRLLELSQAANSFSLFMPLGHYSPEVSKELATMVAAKIGSVDAQ